MPAAQHLTLFFISGEDLGSVLRAAQVTRLYTASTSPERRLTGALVRMRLKLLRFVWGAARFRTIQKREANCRQLIAQRDA